MYKKKFLTFLNGHVLLRNMEINDKRIKFELKQRGWTVRKLSNKIGMSFQNTYLLLTTKVTKFSTVEKIAKALKVEARDLIK